MLFCVSAVCLFTYGITISGFIIDKMGVKYSLMLGLTLYAIGKFVLIFADTRLQLWLVMESVCSVETRILGDNGKM